MSNNGKILVIGNYKHAKRGRSMIRKLAEQLNLSLTKSSEDANIKAAIKWESKHVGQTTYDHSYTGRIINNNTINIDKTLMGNSFEEVFGYNINIDPSKYRGLAVMKGNGQARHNGRIVECPVRKVTIWGGRQACYQVLLDWKTEDGKYFKEYRAPVVGGEVPFVYLKKKTEEQRWLAGCTELEIMHSKDAFSGDELGKIMGFCGEINLDYGEIDILREPVSQRMYIIDVNNTPFGLPRIISDSDGSYAMTELAFYFRKNLLGNI